jgi:hypothetical protein
MAWLEAETNNHCKQLMLFLHDRIFNKYTDWLTLGGCVNYNTYFKVLQFNDP